MADLRAVVVPDEAESWPDSGDTSIAFSQSANSTPASMEKTPFHSVSEKAGISGEADASHNEAETPRESRGPTELLEDQLEQIQAKLAHIQQQHELEHLERTQLEHKITEEVFPITSTMNPMINEDAMYQLLRGRRRRFNHLYHDDSDSDEDTGGSRYLWKAIQTYERGLDRLKREHARISRMQDERKQLGISQMEWLAERKALLAEQDRLQHASKLHDSPEVSEGVPGFESTNGLDKGSASIPRFEKPELNLVEWATFKIASAPGAKSTYAIDVLDGEPALTFQNPHLMHLRTYMKLQEPTKPRKAPANTHTKQPYDGLAPLPERIRINSKHIKKILESINDDVFSGDGPWIMIRPYKGLVYYAESIRHKLEELEKEYGATVPKQSNFIVAETTEKNQIEDNKLDQTVGSDPQTDGEGKQHSSEEGSTSSPMALQHLRCLDEFITCYLNKKLSHLSSDHSRTVSFADIWHLFKPGEEVIEQNRRQAYRIISVTSPAHRVIAPWERTWRKDTEEPEDAVMIHCVRVDFDGKQLGPVSKEVPIARFEGEKAVTSLAVFPLRFADGRRSLDKPENINDQANSTFRQRLISRGRTFLEVTTFKHMYYSGLTDTRDEIDSHVVVDFVEAYSANSDKEWRPELEYLIGSTPKEPEDKNCSAECCRDQGTIFTDSFVDKKRNAEYMALLVPDDQHREPSPAISPRSLDDIKSQANSLLDDDLVIMSDRVCGFVLHSRKWGK